MKIPIPQAPLEECVESEGLVEQSHDGYKAKVEAVDEDGDPEPPPELLEYLDPPALPTWDPKDFQVRDGGVIIGRIKPTHENSPKEAISVYCRLHGCSVPLRRVCQCPPMPQILDWFNAGLHDVPKGQVGKAQHLSLWKAMCPA